MSEEDSHSSQQTGNQATHSLPGRKDFWPRLPEDAALFECAFLEVSDYVQVEDEMALTSALGAMAAACQNLADVAYPNGHVVPCSLMTLIIAGSGERKTAVDRWFCDPIREVEREKMGEDKQQQWQYQKHLGIWKTKRSEIDKKLRKETRDGEPTEVTESALSEMDEIKPTPPKNHQIIYNNTTPEALASGLYQNLPLGYLLSDEGGTVFEGRALQDTTLINDLWSGSDIRVNRKSNDSFILSDARLSASLMIQPEVLNQVLKKKGDKLRETGFFARFLVVYPPPHAGYRESLSYNKPGEDTKQFQQRIRDRLKRSIDKLEKGEQRDILEFTKPAKRLWEDLNFMIQIELRPDGVFYHAKDHGEKLMENITRIAGVIHLFENDDYRSNITEAELRYAYELCRHYSRHYIDHIVGEPRIVTLANELVRAIRLYGTKRGDCEYEFIKTTIKRRAIRDLRENENLDNALGLLMRTGHVQQSRYSNSQYILYEDLFEAVGNREPEIKNGYFYHIKELPIYEPKEKRDEKHREQIEARNLRKSSPSREGDSGSGFGQ